MSIWCILFSPARYFVVAAVLPQIYFAQNCCGLLQTQQVVEEEKRSLNDYISTSREKLLKAVKIDNFLETTETKAQY